MANRSQRAALAAETVEILERGEYIRADGVQVSFTPHLAQAKSQTRLYAPEHLEGLGQGFAPIAGAPAEIEVRNCTTFAAARDVLREDDSLEVLCLNFASAKNPGGGFLSGSQAQEEALARASALYACLCEQMAYYEVNRTCRTALYTDHMIYSPRVPVFRDDADRLLDEPFFVSMVTAPAVNAGAVKQNEPANISLIGPTMLRRMAGVLSIARQHEHATLILGAWGCGVFANDPAEVAAGFHQLLTADERFAGFFRRIIFAVLDHSPAQQTFAAFQRQFS